MTDRQRDGQTFLWQHSPRYAYHHVVNFFLKISILALFTSLVSFAFANEGISGKYKWIICPENFDHQIKNAAYDKYFGWKIFAMISNCGEIGLAWCYHLSSCIFWFKLVQQSPYGYAFFINTPEGHKTDNKGACSNLIAYHLVFYLFYVFSLVLSHTTGYSAWLFQKQRHSSCSRSTITM